MITRPAALAASAFVRAQTPDFRDPITGMRWAPADPFICLVEGDPPADPPPAGDPPKTLGMDEVNAIVAKERRKLEAKFADYDALKESAAKAYEFEKQLAEMQQQLELAGKSGAEKEKLLAEKLHAKTESEKAELARAKTEAESKADAAREALRAVRIEHQLAAALTTAKALPAAISSASRIFMAEATIEMDDETGKVTSVEYDGVPYPDIAKASEAFLKANPYFQSVPVGGGGTRASSTGSRGDLKGKAAIAAELDRLGLTGNRR